MTPKTFRPPHLDEQGFTLLELVIAMFIILLGLGIWMKGTHTVSPRVVHSPAQIVRTRMVESLARMHSHGGDAVFYVDPATSGDVRGRFLAVAGPVGIDRTTPGAAEAWVDLTGGAQWGWGSASAAPSGGAPSGIPGTVRCNAHTGCELGALDRVTYYLTHNRDPWVVEAIVLTKDMDVQLYHYQNGTGRWITRLD